jgi:DnaJ-class molecular chaperone
MTTWPKRDKDGRHVASAEVEVGCKECNGEGWYYYHDETGHLNHEVCEHCKGTGKVKCQ